MIRVGILGAKGYAAGEIVRILRAHPEARVQCLMDLINAPEPLQRSFPALRGGLEPLIEPVDVDAMASRVDAVFLATPHTVAQQYVPAFIAKGVKAFDLSADFRFDSIKLFEETYGVKHLAPDLNARIPYALMELFRADLAGAPALAIPGCYTTASILALAPFMKRADALELDRIVINAVSGVSGAGRTPSEATHFVAANESVTAYKVGAHRHRPEIEEKLSRLAGSPIRVTFTPHLVPMTRGIHATITIPMKRDVTTAEALGWLNEAYAGEPFIRVLPSGELPATGAVVLTNLCDLAAVADAHSRTLIVLSTIDNLIKGASGQAVQAMNALLGLPETMGLLSAAP
jgi:N-acetyl-gamma-glutamyl-phosphate reductase